MNAKTDDESDSRRRADTDTRSYAQSQGAQKPGEPQDRHNARMPHERDESARATGDRMQEDPVPSERQISDARGDVKAGRVDTERRGIPNDVPGAKPKPGE